MPHDLLILGRAREDLDEITDWVAAAAGVDTALAYLARMEAACRALIHYPARGTPRHDLAPNLRSVPFERGAIIFYVVVPKQVQVVRVLRRGRAVTPDLLAP